MIEETREDYIKRLAQNRYDLRMQNRWKLWETDKDDWRVAEEQVRKEEMINHDKIRNSI